MDKEQILRQISDEIYKPVKKKFVRRKVIAFKPDDVWAADLVDLKQFKDDNNGNQYLLNIIDVFSKYAWAIPVKDKTAKQIKNALEQIFTENNRKPQKLWVDKGGEFYNKEMDKLLKGNNISRYSTYSENKASVIERFNRTLKTNMWKDFSFQDSANYLKVLPTLLDDYNTKKIHRSIGMTPEQASRKENQQEVWDKLYGKYFGTVPSEPPKFKVGDVVRISKVKGVFEKGYLPSWSEELFKISKVINSNPYTYKIKDLAGEEIEGSFYEPELQESQVDIEIGFVEKVLKRKTVKGKKMVFVKYIGYPDKFNAWIPEKDLF